MSAINTGFAIQGLIILTSGSVGLLVGGVSVYMSKGKYNDWQEVEGIVTNVSPNHFDKNYNYYNITYTYSVVPSSITPSPLADPSTSLPFTPVENTQRSATDINHAYRFYELPPKVGDKATIWYDKSDPSVVKFSKPSSRKDKATSGTVMIIFGTIFTFICLLLFCGFIIGLQGVIDFLAIFAVFSLFDKVFH